MFRLKLLKLSTYNSLKNQLKLKDNIISNASICYNNQSNTIGHLHDRISELLKSKTESTELIKEIQYTLANRTVEKIELQRMNENQQNTIHSMSENYHLLLVELDKYKGKRDIKGRYIKKVK